MDTSYDMTQKAHNLAEARRYFLDVCADIEYSEVRSIRLSRLCNRCNKLFVIKATEHEIEILRKKAEEEAGRKNIPYKEKFDNLIQIFPEHTDGEIDSMITGECERCRRRLMIR